MITKDNITPSGWWIEEKDFILPVDPMSSHAKVMREYILGHPEEGGRLGLNLGMTPTELWQGAVEGGCVRYRLYNDQRQWNPKDLPTIRDTNSINAVDYVKGCLFAHLLRSFETLPPSARIIMGDPYGGLMYEGTLGDLFGG